MGGIRFTAPLQPGATRARRPRVRLMLAGLVLCCAYGWLASGARPFTDRADVLTAVPLAVLALAEVARRLRLLGGWPPGREARGSLSGWLAAFGVLAAFELANYLQGPRRLHPTISSLAGELQAHRPGDAVFFACWLVAGSYLVTR